MQLKCGEEVDRVTPQEAGNLEVVFDGMLMESDGVICPSHLGSHE